MKKIFVLGTLMLALMLGSKVFAAGGIELTLSVEQDSRVVSADIEISDDFGGTAVTGLVVNGDGDVVFAVQGFTDEDGMFGFSYVNDDADGYYTLTVSAPRKKLYASDSFKMVTMAMKEEISETAKDSAGMRSIVENYGTYINLDMEKFNLLSDQDAVYEFMAKDSMIDLTDIKSITDVFYGAVIVRTLAEGGTSDDYIDFLKSNTYSILNKDGIPAGKKECLFDELAKDVKEGVLEAVVGKDYTSAAELSDSLSFYVLEQSLEKALQWTEVNPVMKKYQEAGLLDVDFKTYNKLKKPQNADSKMMGESFESYNEIKSAFEEAVDEALKKEKKSSGGSSGGSGGGGGGGMVIPAVKVPEPVEKPMEEAKNIFTDMADYMWANEAVTYLADKGIINGVGDGKFAPANGLTREEVSTIMVKVQKLSVDGKVSAFSDVPADRWSYPYVSAANEAGLMVGVSADMFGATAQITRNEFAAIMKRLIDLYGVELPVNTTAGEYDDDMDIPEWAKESVIYMKGTGLMLGNTGNRFDGNEIVSRAYACDILYAVLNAVNYDAEV